ncbi:MAG TPA: hypothetical protein VEC12_13490 [Bacteroidia bacterium]|nr:hypothetical protein [Bacteroidia bacterium]
MKTALTIFILLTCLLGLNSCKKDTDDKPVHLVIEGHVKETQTGKVIPFARIRLLEYVSGNIGGFGSYNILAEVLSDTSGFYKIDAGTNTNKHLFIDVEQKQYRYFSMREFTVASGYRKEDINLDIPGYVKVFIENTSQHDSVTLIVWVENSQSKSRSGLIGGLMDVFEASSKTNGKVFFNVIKNGVATKYIDSIDIPFWDTAYYNKIV